MCAQVAESGTSYVEANLILFCFDGADCRAELMIDELELRRNVLVRMTHTVAFVS